MNEDQESPGFNVTVALAGNAIDVLEQLFIKGPTARFSDTSGVAKSE